MLQLALNAKVGNSKYIICWVWTQFHMIFLNFLHIPFVQFSLTLRISFHLHNFASFSLIVHSLQGLLIPLTYKSFFSFPLVPLIFHSFSQFSPFPSFFLNLLTFFSIRNLPFISTFHSFPNFPQFFHFTIIFVFFHYFLLFLLFPFNFFQIPCPSILFWNNLNY